MEKIKVDVDEDLEDIMPGFLKNREGDIADLTKAIEEKDDETVKSIGHKLSGNAGGYGLDALGEIGQEIENAGVQKDWAKVQSELDNMKDYLNRLEINYV